MAGFSIPAAEHRWGEESKPIIFQEIYSFPIWLSWPWSYGSWIYDYLCNQCLSPLMLWIRISIRARFTTLCDKVCQRLATGQWSSPGPPVSSTNKTDRHDITEYVENGIKHHQTNIKSWSSWKIISDLFYCLANYSQNEIGSNNNFMFRITISEM